jgi:hypothetical protein
MHRIPTGDAPIEKRIRRQEYQNTASGDVLNNSCDSIAKLWKEGWVFVIVVIHSQGPSVRKMPYAHSKELLL